MVSDHNSFANLIWQIVEPRVVAPLAQKRSALIAAAVTGQLDLTTGEGAAP